MIVQLGTPPFVLPDGFVNWNADAENAFAQWNEQLGRVQFTWTETPVGTGAARHDGKNQVLFANSAYNYSFGGGVLAVTLLNSSGNVATEADVLFNPNNRFSSGLVVAPSKDFHRVALHEFGHVLGLDHPDQAKPKQAQSSIMHSTVTGLNHLADDDVAGITALYGLRPGRPPVTGNARLTNISTRGHVGTGENVLIAGLIIRNQAKQVLLRALGPTLSGFGVAGPLADPVLDLRNSGGSLIFENDNWKDAQQAAIQQTALAPPNDLEPAILSTLAPASYTAILSGKNASSGVALVEVYDRQTTAGELGNISTRGQVLGAENVLIAGFIVKGPQLKNVVLRAIGPGLSGRVSRPLPNPTIELRNSAQQLVETDTRWQSNTISNSYVPFYNLAPPNANDSALFGQLGPGNYTVIVRSATNATGIALAEVYDVD